MLDVKALLTKICLRLSEVKPLLVEEKTLIDNWTVTKNGNNYTSVNVAKTGYKAIGIVGFRLQNATTGGTYNTYCSQHSMYMSATNTVWFLVRNNNTANDAKIKVVADILYEKI